MTTTEFVQKYGVKPSHICKWDIVSIINLGCIFVHSEAKNSHEFGVAVFPLPGQQFPDRATLGKAESAGLKLHGVRDCDGAFIYLFDPTNEEQARAAIQVAGLDRCSGPESKLPGLGGRKRRGSLRRSNQETQQL
jgi:hypothetical protein